MPLAPGQRIGTYDIVAALGAGGMGEVYRARDSRLKRDVAIKVLPADVATDRERLARFQREAEVLASLNHPNIAQVYGIEDASTGSGQVALVMELVEGEDLSQRITRGAIPLDEALPIAKQIADALEAAHDAGVIHRDLKPANIKVRADGAVKVLDFGLAKALDQGSGIRGQGSVNLADSPTITSPAMTMHGVILGTAAYMSPEQAKGRIVDKRADAWAFGCVLYEMLTGQRAFKGDDVTEIITSVMRDTPDWGALPAETPIPVRVLLGRCLEKDPRKRTPHMAVARFDLDGAAASSTVISSARSTPANRLGWALIAGSVLAVIAALVTGWFARAYIDGGVPLQSYRTTLLIQENMSPRPPSSRFALSPDGRRLAYVAVDPSDGRVRLWARRLDSAVGQVLPGTDNALAPFWSPDSRFVGFFALNSIKKVDMTGGPPSTIAQGIEGVSAAWNQDGVILVAANQGLYRLSENGGAPQAVSGLSANAKQVFDHPAWLPDGKHFVYMATRGEASQNGVFVATIDGGTPVRLLEEISNARYANGQLVFLRAGALVAQPFDAGGARLVGDAKTLADSVLVTLTSRPGAAFSVSANGSLVYQTSANLGAGRLIWSNRESQQTTIADDPQAFRDLSLSPDGTQLLMAPLDASGRSDLWILNIARNVRTRLTFNNTGNSGAWAPDGRSVLYRGQADELHWKNADGSGDDRAVASITGCTIPLSISSDGREVLCEQSAPNSSNNIVAVTLDGSAPPRPIANTPASERWAQFSPDGRWIAYTSDESGAREVFLKRRDGSGRWQVSQRGGTYPRWSRDGKELFFWDPAASRIEAAPIRRLENSIEIGTLTPLIEARAPNGFQRNFYDVAPDGRFITTVPSGNDESRIELLTNWPTLLRSTP